MHIHSIQLYRNSWSPCSSPRRHSWWIHCGLDYIEKHGLRSCGVSWIFNIFDLYKVTIFLLFNLCNCKMSQLNQYFHLSLDLLWILLWENYLAMICNMSSCLNCTIFPHLHSLVHFGLWLMKQYITGDVEASRREGLVILQPVYVILLTYAVGMMQKLASYADFYYCDKNINPKWFVEKKLFICHTGYFCYQNDTRWEPGSRKRSRNHGGTMLTDFFSSWLNQPDFKTTQDHPCPWVALPIVGWLIHQSLIKKMIQRLAMASLKEASPQLMLPLPNCL